MYLPSVSDIALKEWATAVKALGQGEQILALRKGGFTARIETSVLSTRNSFCFRLTNIRKRN